MYNQMIKYIKKKYPLINGVDVKLNDIIFEERVKINCFYCGRYNNNWKCPPNIPSIDYKKMLNEFDNAAFLWICYKIDDNNYNDVRRDSSIILHKALLDAEKYFYNQNKPMSISFIGGSCKLCKNGCGLEKCNDPYSARIPLEAIGVNVIKSAEKYCINIQFPTNLDITRIGLILW